MPNTASELNAAPRKSLRTGRHIAWLAAMPMIMGIGVFALYPFVYLIALALTDSSLARPFQEWTGLANFADALSDELFVGSVWRSALLALLSTATAMLLGTAVALLLDKAVRGRDLIRTLILLPLLTPPVTAAIMWQLILMPQGGWLNAVLSDLSIISSPVSFLGHPSSAFASVLTVDVWQWSPFVALMVYAALQTLPREVFEASRLDVRSNWTVFRYITLPMLLPALLGIAVLKLVISFKVFDLIFVLTAGGPGQATTVSSFYIYRVAVQQFDIGLAAAQTLMFALVVGLATVPFTVAHDKSEEKLS
ncbi:carbohydrate ABC transporter permease [Hoeflea prorocentri]|uniref:Sugar ABC transporter permease n=1 Tax=Hoeflea prorocentri TaxID=1922333 RepID=A0A9X3ZJC2_9HYPH|nr:sugar ABC transporter permease [Hoeflea prorocentri]MCY6383757.1 sugar ABC transporter permease [Hoeflea prorocentri]MDA5401557.1 sugar ABC transporter permease [Hoeflea prorocentri]